MKNLSELVKGMKQKWFFLYLLVFVAASLVLNVKVGLSQNIHEPDGLNMPGSWCEPWTNLETCLAFANGTQFEGGRIEKKSVGTTRWQTIFSVAETGADVVGGAYNWLFTSGPSTNYYQNKWAGINVVFDLIQDYTYNTGSDNQISLANGKWYTMNWKDSGYENTSAIFMETSAEPVSILTVSEPVGEVDADTPVDITITTSAIPSAEEIFYLRYSTDGFTTSTAVKFTMTDAEGTAQIPGQTYGTTVEYYVFSSTVDNVTSDFDMYTIHLNNGSGANYTFAVGDPVISWGNLQFPENGIIEKESEFVAYGRVTVPTVTGSGAPAEGPENLSAWIGFSETNATQVTDFESLDWTWIAATYNTYVADYGNSSQYSADIGTGITISGTYYYVSRFQYDGGDFYYGGYNGGEWGETTNVAGELTVVDQFFPVNFEVTNNSDEVTEVKIKGTFNAWTLVPMVNSSGNIWTFTVDVAPGSYEWGIADQDDTWLLTSNLQFSVGGDGTVTGDATYIYPPPTFGIRDDEGVNLPSLTYWFTGEAVDITEKGDEFDSKNLGSISDLYLKGANIKTWKSGEGNVTAAKFQYKLWKTAEAEPDNYSERNVGFTSNDGDGNQTWADFGSQISLTEGLEQGAYSVKVRFEVEGTGVPGDTLNGPFTATFTNLPSAEAEITGFSFTQQTGVATISSENSRIDIEVAVGTPVTSLTPTIEISDFATIDPLSGVAQDFTNPFVYTVTAEDNTTEKEWTVYVTVAQEMSSEAEITGFTLEKQTGDAVINSEGATVTIEVENGTDLTNLTPTITISVLAEISPASGVVQDFSSPFVYTVTAEDDTEKEWTVTVTEAEPPAPNYGIRDDEGINLPTITYWYSEQPTDLVEKGAQFNEKQIGEISALYIKGASIKTWKVEGGNVTAANFSYKIWENSSTEPESYTVRSVAFSTNDGDGNQTWADFGDQINIADELEAGDYNLKILFSIEGTGIPGIAEDGPFTATFSKAEEQIPGITYANLQHPESGSCEPQSEFLVFARVYIEGQTGSAVPESGVENLSAWIGYSTTDATSSIDFETGWTWIPASYNVYAEEFGNNSQYSADLGSAIDAEGTYYYVSRFQYNEGDFVYGGFSQSGGGFWDGETNVSGVLTVENLPEPEITWANLQHPATGIIEPEADFTVYAQVLVNGYSGSVAPVEGIENLSVWIGYSDANAVEVADFGTGWTWVSAEYNPYEESFGNNSQYSANIGSNFTEDGIYFYVSRFQLADGDFIYGGFSESGGGFWDGLENYSGVLTVQSAEPTTYPVTFTIIDGTESYSNIKLKIEIDSEWVSYEMNRSGFTWTKLLELKPGAYDWGAFEDDGTEEGIWLIDEGNLWVAIAENGDIAGMLMYTIENVSDYIEGFYKFSLYPNPTSGIINLNFSGDISYKVIDISGRVVKNGIANGVIDIAELNSGIYFISFDFKGVSVTRKVVRSN